MARIFAAAAIFGTVDFFLDRLLGTSSTPRGMSVSAMVFTAIAALMYALKVDRTIFVSAALFCATYSAALLLGWTDDLSGRMLFVLILVVLALISMAIIQIVRRLRKEKT